jgi:mannose-6-phosphate isomerase
MNVPLRFHPHLRPLVWGGRRLGEILGRSLPTGDAYGESWEVSDHASHRSVVADSPYAGRTLRDLMEYEPAALLGSAANRYATFPWLVKYLDAWDWLSVQVHPNEKDVKRLWPGEGSKTEAWFVLGAAPTSRVFAGLLPGVGEAELRAALATGTVADCLHQFQPRPGDCLFLPAGTVHAVGGGVLMAEVQQTSDATFRLFDWYRKDAQGRARTLHVEEALACINWKGGPVQPMAAAGYPEGRNAAAVGPAWQELVRCPYFTLEYVRQTEPFTCGGTGRLQVLIVLHGHGQLTASGQRRDLRPGDVLVLPADLERISYVPKGPVGLLLSTLPG